MHKKTIFSFKFSISMHLTRSLCKTI